MSCLIAIPVHLQSRRVERKAILPIQGRPLLWHVWQSAISAEICDVAIVSDSIEILSLAQEWGARAIHAPSAVNGTERLSKVIDSLRTDYVVNVQADMPHIPPDILWRIVEGCQPDRIVTPVYRIRERRDLQSDTIVKVVANTEGRSLYFSRHPIPYLRDCEPGDWLDNLSYLGHIGIYGYPHALLEEYATLAVPQAESAERLEQLRWLAAGIPLWTTLVDAAPLAIDRADDLARLTEISR